MMLVRDHISRNTSAQPAACLQEAPMRKSLYRGAHSCFFLFRSFGNSFGHKFATMWVVVKGLSSVASSFAFTMFSCQRRLAHFLKLFSGENFVRATYINLAFLRMAFDVRSVFL